MELTLDALKVLPTKDELWEKLKEALPATTSLYYVDYRDDLNQKTYETFAENVLQGDDPYGFEDAVSESIWEWDNWETVREYMKDAMKSVLSDYDNSGDYDEGQVEDIEARLEDLDDWLRDLVRDRDDSTPVKDLMSNTTDYTVRVHLMSNYEGIDSAWDIRRSGVTYDNYTKQMIDAMNLNPATFKKDLIRYGFDVAGRWPNKTNRDGKGYVSSEKLIRELNETCSLNQLVIIGTLDPAELKDFTGKIKFSKGAPVGFFSSWNGSGSPIEAELLRDMVIDVNKQGETCYDKFSAHIDSQHGYSMDATYGPTRKFWGEGVTLS